MTYNEKSIDIFDDTNRIEAESSRKGEVRCQVIGLVNGLMLFVVYMIRNDKKRIISARKASQDERRAYYETKD